MSGVWLVGQHGEIRTGHQTSPRLHRLLVLPERGQGQTHPRALADLKYKNQETSHQTHLSGPAADVSDRVTYSHKETKPPWLAPETHTEALEKQLEGTRITRKGDPYP